MNKLLENLKEESTHAVTANGGATYNTTKNAVADLFALGGAYRQRTDKDCILLFKKAFAEDPTLAMRCLFYLRDIREGQGERRYFRVVIRWLAQTHPDFVKRNLEAFPLMGRWDDLYSLIGTPYEKDAFAFMYRQLALDIQSKTPSLLAKWLKSCNTSSTESRKLGEKTRTAFRMTAKQYRKTLSVLRERINIVERLMSANRWDLIEWDKIPSRAGLIYRNAFARHDLEQKYEEFVRSSETKVNANTLYPCDVVHQALNCHEKLDGLNRAVINKYWDNLHDYFQNATFDGIAVVDTSGSMTNGLSIRPIDVAISLGIYCAEKCNKNSPFYGHYISFSAIAKLVPVEGIDFVDKVQRIQDNCIIENTNIQSVFDLILNTAKKNHLTQKDLPSNVVIISDMEFDEATCEDYYASRCGMRYSSDMEAIAQQFIRAGYKCPNLVFWNVNAANDTIPMKMENGITFVSGNSPIAFEMLLSGKTAWDLILEKLNSDRYKNIH